MWSVPVSSHSVDDRLPLHLNNSFFKLQLLRHYMKFLEPPTAASLKYIVVLGCKIIAILHGQY